LVSDLQGFQKPYRSETKMSSSVIWHPFHWLFGLSKISSKN
jgi:hypothetical protein